MNTALCLMIGKTWYRLISLSPNPVGDPAWKLMRIGKLQRSYEVIYRFGRAECNCPDFVWRREHTGEACKHVAALFENGLLPRRPSCSPTK